MGIAAGRAAWRLEPVVAAALGCQLVKGAYCLYVTLLSLSHTHTHTRIHTQPDPLKPAARAAAAALQAEIRQAFEDFQSGKLQRPDDNPWQDEL